MRSLQLNIAGLSISVTTTRSDEDVREVTELVNKHVRALAGKGHLPQVQQLAVIALTLAQELLDTRAQLDQANAALDEATTALETTLAALRDGP